MSNYYPFLKKVTLPKKYGRIEAEWIEYSFRSRLMPPHGYWITLAAIIVPDKSLFVVGVSACSPYDSHLFDRTDASNRALGRARQLAGKAIMGKLDPNRQTLAGPETECVYLMAPPRTVDMMMEIEPLYRKVALAARATSLGDELKRVSKAYPDYQFTYDRTQRMSE